MLPSLSDTEREAIEAGDVWWDADLFTGNPDWNKLLAFAPAKLSDEEQAFLAGPVEELCAMLDDWKINWEWRDLPPEVWDFIKAHKFFAMIIPKEYGGLGFSAYAHSEVIRKLSTRSITAAVTAMVPNSLGPGELAAAVRHQGAAGLLAAAACRGEEIPCFGLTSPEAGSDAASMIDSGVVCRGTFEGREMLGIRLNWHKRYITLGPIATVLGLAFKLLRSRSPDRRSATTSASRSRWCRPICPASRSAAAICRRCRFSRTARTGAATCSSRWTTSSAASSRSAKAGRC